MGAGLIPYRTTRIRFGISSAVGVSLGSGCCDERNRLLKCCYLYYERHFQVSQDIFTSCRPLLLFEFTLKMFCEYALRSILLFCEVKGQIYALMSSIIRCKTIYLFALFPFVVLQTVVDNCLFLHFMRPCTQLLFVYWGFRARRQRRSFCAHNVILVKLEC